MRHCFEASRFWRRVRDLRIGPSHYFGELQQCRVRQLVLLDNGVKADALFAVLFVVGQLYALCIIGCRTSVFDNLRNGLRRDEEEFRIFVNELLYQPRTRYTVDFRLLTRNPFHAVLPHKIIYVNRVLAVLPIRTLW